jgi:hypothetical protein
MNLPSTCEEFAERSAGIAVALLVNFYFRYNQVELHSESHDITIFQTLLKLL